MGVPTTTDPPMILQDSDGQRWEVIGPGCPTRHRDCPHPDSALSCWRVDTLGRRGAWPECVDGRSLYTPSLAELMDRVEASARRLVASTGVNIYQCGACGQPTPWGDVCARCQEPLQ